MSERGNGHTFVVNTWADGSGVWHATVETYGDVQTARKAARRAISAEIKLRHQYDRLGEVRLEARSEQTSPQRYVFGEV